MSHTGFATSTPDINDLGELHSVTVALDPEIARQMTSAATALCTSASRHAPDGPYDDVKSGLQGQGVLFSSPRRLMAGLGVAARLTVSGGTQREASSRSVAGFIASVPCVDPIRRPGSGPTAFGAMPFDPSASGELVIPKVTIVSEPDGQAWMTLVGRGPLLAPDLSGDEELSANPDDREEPSSRGRGARPRSIETDENAFTEGVRRALAEIANGRMKKVVLARKVAACFGQPIDIAKTFDSLKRREPSSTVFAIISPNGTFMGASPELLVAKDGPNVRSVPLAGTVRRTGDDASDQIEIARMVESAKENLEHRLVVDAVSAKIARFCGDCEIPPDPEVFSLRQLAHLATRLSATLEGDPRGWPSVLELATALHPTPAVGGFPTGPALELIESVEPSGRGLYAGPVGWVDANGDGDFFIGIRSAQVHGASASVHAGAGIVSGSDPTDELAETAVKLDTMLGAIATN